MAAVKDRVTEEALSLPADARLSLIEELIASLNLPTSEEIELAWAEEAERRVAEIEAGEASLQPGEEVFARLRAKYRPATPLKPISTLSDQLPGRGAARCHRGVERWQLGSGSPAPAFIAPKCPLAVRADLAKP